MMTLLDKAKAVKPFRARRTARFAGDPVDRLEVAIAYLRQEISVTQLCAAVGIKPRGLYGWLGATFVRAVRDGLLVPKTK